MCVLVIVKCVKHMVCREYVNAFAIIHVYNTGYNVSVWSMKHEASLWLAYSSSSQVGLLINVNKLAINRTPCHMLLPALPLIGFANT